MWERLRGQRVILAVLAPLGLLLVASRLYTYHEPADRDLATYVIIGRELLRGRPLYSDLWDHKPPLLYAGFAAALALAGSDRAAVLLVAAVCGLLTLAAIYLATAAATGSRRLGLVAAGFWVLVSNDLRLEANRPNTEVLINTAMAWALVPLLHMRAGRMLRDGLVAGCCIAAATLVKPVVAAAALTFAVAHVAYPPQGSSRRQALLSGLAIVAATPVAWALTMAYFALSGRFRPFWDTLIVFNGAFAGDMLGNVASGLGPERLIPLAMRPMLPLVTLAALGIVLPLLRPSRAAALTGAYALATFLAVTLSGRFHPHYYQLWLPLLCIGGAVALAPLDRPEAGQGRALSVPAALVTAALLALFQLPSYRLPPPEWSRIKYGDVFVRAAQLGADIDRMLAPGETFFQWANEPELYFGTGRRAPAGVFWAEFMLEGPLRLGLRTQVLEQLSRDPPELIVIDRERPIRGALGRWMEERYERFRPPRPDTGFAFMYLKGGRLEARVRSATAASDGASAPRPSP